MAPTDEDVQLAKEASPRLRARDLCVSAGGQPVDLPPGVLRVLVDAVDAMAQGKAVELIPTNASKELTTRQAAKVLGISRPSFIQLLDLDKIPYRTTGGNHRRILYSDVIMYKETHDREVRLTAEQVQLATEQLREAVQKLKR